MADWRQAHEARDHRKNEMCRWRGRRAIAPFSSRTIACVTDEYCCARVHITRRTMGKRHGATTRRRDDMTRHGMARHTAAQESASASASNSRTNEKTCILPETPIARCTSPSTSRPWSHARTRFIDGHRCLLPEKVSSSTLYGGGNSPADCMTQHNIQHRISLAPAASKLQLYVRRWNIA